MDWIKAFLSNEFAMTGILAWLIAQVVKTIIHFAVYGKLDFQRMFGNGGMPSGHSATVASLALMCALRFGLESVEFAISGILAVIVCRDAMGVRRETGKQAAVINELLQSSEQEHKEADLKELVGHTPLQVVVGVIIGLGTALLMHYVIL